jgi:Holliday junction resolvase-like predicted endonuclease
MATTNYPPEITEARQLYREGKQRESRDCLQAFLLQQPAHIDALLWLARVTLDSQEAIAAAELALKLDPGNEVAQRAVIAVRKRASESPTQAAEQAELTAAVALSTGMTLAQARAVKWPFRGINRPIGEVLDDGTITLRDLWWGLENAYDTRIRDAAKTILLTHLVGAEPKEPPPPLNVVTGSRFSERQERRSLLFAGLLAGFLLALSAGIIILTITTQVLKRVYGWQMPVWISLVVYIAIGIMWAINRLAERHGDEADQYRLGRWGEEQVVDLLRYSLDGRWTLFRNFEWPNRKWGDVDLILVGLGGIWAFEVKAYSGQIRNVGDRWQRKARWGWRKLTSHPGRQASRNAARLKEYLEGQDVNVRWVQPVVIWAGEQGVLTIEDPATPVWDLEELSDHIEDLWQSKSLTEETVQQAVGVLDQAVRTSEEAR